MSESEQSIAAVEPPTPSALLSPLGTLPLMLPNAHPPKPDSGWRQPTLPFSFSNQKQQTQTPEPSPTPEPAQPEPETAEVAPEPIVEAVAEDVVDAAAEVVAESPQIEPTASTSAAIIQIPDEVPVESIPPAVVLSDITQPITPAVKLPADAHLDADGEPLRRVGRGGVELLPRAKASMICAFCIKPASQNKFGRKEFMVSCWECGSAGHPSCLEWTDEKMIRKVKRYCWCCEHCKRCEVCDLKGDSDEDGNQTILCDTCDRGWHQLCLTPQLEAIPDGIWSCPTCAIEGTTPAPIKRKPVNTSPHLTKTIKPPSHHRKSLGTPTSHLFNGSDADEWSEADGDKGKGRASSKMSDKPWLNQHYDFSEEEDEGPIEPAEPELAYGGILTDAEAEVGDRKPTDDDRLRWERAKDEVEMRVYAQLKARNVPLLVPPTLDQPPPPPQPQFASNNVITIEDSPPPTPHLESAAQLPAVAPADAGPALDRLFDDDEPASVPMDIVPETEHEIESSPVVVEMADEVEPVVAPAAEVNADPAPAEPSAQESELATEALVTNGVELVPVVEEDTKPAEVEIAAASTLDALAVLADAAAEQTDPEPTQEPTKETVEEAVEEAQPAEVPETSALPAQAEAFPEPLAKASPRPPTPAPSLVAPAPPPPAPAPKILKPLPGGIPIAKIEHIRFGEYEIATWYQAPFPDEFTRVADGKLWLCEFCLKYMKGGFQASRHRLKCKTRHPPGDEIYRDGAVSVYEVDGRKNKIYCQNLCLLAKMFLDHKTLYYDVEPFLFYVMTTADKAGAKFVGYFSKEKRSPTNNVSCIMTLPVRQRQGWGNLLIDFSYLLSKKEGRQGTPERPLSDLGRLSYENYWTLIVFQHLHAIEDQSTVTIQSITDATAMTAEDVYTTLRDHAMIHDLDAPAPEPRLRRKSNAEGPQPEVDAAGAQPANADAAVPPPRPRHANQWTNRKKSTVRIAKATLAGSSSSQPHDDHHIPPPPVIPSRYKIEWDKQVVAKLVNKAKAKGYRQLRPDRLKWSPFLVSRYVEVGQLEPGEGATSLIENVELHDQHQHDEHEHDSHDDDDDDAHDRRVITIDSDDSEDDNSRAGSRSRKRRLSVASFEEEDDEPVARSRKEKKEKPYIPRMSHLRMGLDAFPRKATRSSLSTESVPIKVNGDEQPNGHSGAEQDADEDDDEGAVAELLTNHRGARNELESPAPVRSVEEGEQVLA